ncbi:MAG: endopeptidase La [Legionellaceae bacterium]|nr:endopeptidase La [Legionellaceae bacterium]
MSQIIDPISDGLLPVLPLRDVVIYPNMVIPLFVGRARSIKALEASMLQSGKRVFLATQKSAKIDDPGIDDLYQVGTEAVVLQLLKLPDGTIKLLVEGEARAKIVDHSTQTDFIAVEIEHFGELYSDLKETDLREVLVLHRSALSLFEKYVKLYKKLPVEVLSSLAGIEESDRLADTIAAHLNLKLKDKQVLLETAQIKDRLEKLIAYIEGEIELLKVEKRLHGRVEAQMKKSQRDYYLNEQLKAIHKELGDNAPKETEELVEKIKKSGMTKEASEKALAEVEKLKQMPAMSAEATVLRNYLDYLLAVPWKKKSKVKIDLDKAQKLLDKRHYGLGKVQERFVEYLAVEQRVSKLRGPILCLVGPPGVGKTSLGQSIAEATGRKFTRVSLGGVRDEAEIRGHRRTYIGSMPGKIIQKLSKTEVKNPVFMLDEIDKMAMDFRGDPASALLEVLDPEQNNAFNDHYLEVDYDLSSVMFIATANTLDIPPALLDRMEIIRLSGYTEAEKIHIARNHLLPKQLEANGLQTKECSLSDEVIRDIIRYYTREAGVRNLEREIAKICRKVVKQLVVNKKRKRVAVTPDNLEDYLGVRQFHYGVADEKNQVGQVTGLAWTEVGGELLRIEAASVSGKGRVTLTGQLGEVMQESIQAAMTVVRSRASALKISQKYFDNHDIHIHLPEGAIPKDGPSAGIGMCTALVSMATNTPVRADVAMTGEITLRGEVLPIGGLKEKLLAAHRGGIKNVLIPHENEKDLKEIPDNIKADLKIHPVRWIDEVLALVFDPPLKKPASKRKPAKKSPTKSRAKKKTTSKKKATKKRR